MSICHQKLCYVMLSFDSLWRLSCIMVDGIMNGIFSFECLIERKYQYTSSNFLIYKVCIWQLLFLPTYFTIQLIFITIYGHIVFFGTIHESFYTISTNFYLYLQYFQQKVFNFNKINKSPIDLNQRTLCFHHINN